MKKTLILLFCISTTLVFAQENTDVHTEQVWRVNFINPGIEIEMPNGQYSTFSAGFGVGYGGSYPALTIAGSGFLYVVSPFVDLQEKWFYNLNKRKRKEKNIRHNSGNFVSIRMISRGYAIAENIVRTTNIDFAIGPTWGIQRSYGNSLHLLFDAGPIYYFDTNGRGGFSPLMLQLNVGFDLRKKSLKS